MLTQRLIVRITLPIVLLTVVAASSYGADPVRVTIEPSLGLWFGQTNYDFEIVDPSYAPPVKLASRLEFPLDAFLVGGQVSLGTRPGADARWAVELRIQFSVKDPTEKMVDYDWAGYVTEPQTLFSYTESDVEMNAALLRLRYTRDLVVGKASTFGVFGGLEYQGISQNIIGYTGWALDTLGTRVSVAGSEPAIDYKITYFLPQVGVIFRRELGTALRLDAEAGFLGVHADDRDDHLLRNKVAEADGFGYGGTGKLALRYQPPSREGRRLPFVTISFDLLTLKANTDQSQYWYGDDPASDGFDDTGTRFNGLIHDITSTQYRVEFRLGFPL